MGVQPRRDPESGAHAHGTGGPKIGVLGLQGDFERHTVALERLGATVVRVVRGADLAGLDALVMPGGESTTMLRLLAAGDLRGPLEAFVREKPVLGTCAGVILLGTEATDLPAPPLGAIDLSVERNAYGRQLDSFHAELDAPVVGGRFPGVFIRAPRLGRVGQGVEVIATLPAREGRPAEAVGVRSGRIVGLCFHPELTDDTRFHRWFIERVAGLTLPVVPRSAAAAAPSADA